jgi:2-keto-4-pentenoate hydratase/2-oxohepta-3-ene-1,7-dioic acid hydratase in catechol pathway
MTISILRTHDAWWVQTPTGAAKITTSAVTTGELLSDRPAIDAAAHSSGTVPVDSLELVSPVTAPCRVVAQMTNFASHVKDAGMDPKSIPLTFFRKTSGSISGPFDDIVKPDHVRVLDYEVEIGLVVGGDIPVGTTITEANLSDYIAARRHQRRVGPRHSATANAVLRGQVVSDVHPRRTRAGPAGCRRAQAIR